MMKRKLSLLILALFIFGTMGVKLYPAKVTKAAVPTHPFLLVKESEYPELRKRAAQEPWKSMKVEAMRKAGALTYNTGFKAGDYPANCNLMTEIMEACSLAYILDLDENNKKLYREKILDTFTYWEPGISGNLRDDLSSSNWNYAVPPGNAFFSSVLALDIIYPDLTSTERATAERRLGNVAKWFRQSTMNWLANKWGAYGIWALYAGDKAGSNEAIKGYTDAVVSFITPDGVGATGTGYAKARFSETRNAKQYFMDILAHTKKVDFYQMPEVAKFYEWLYGYTVTPFKQLWVFGDTALSNAHYLQSSIYKAGHFSAAAANYAAWLMEGRTQAGSLMAYVLHTQAGKGTPQRAPSKIFPDGGAYFFERSNAPTAMSSVLWNCRQTDGHAHKEVNSLNAAAYGEMLLVNAGYNGWATGAAGFSWDYIFNRAVSGNTALIDYTVGDERNPNARNDHQRKYGNGISEGLTTDLFGYACGDSGKALPNGKHLRNLLSIFPQDGQNGYWVLFDELRADIPGKNAHIALHAPTTSCLAVSPLKEYRWTVNNLGKNVALSVFLGTAPTQAELKQGVIGQWANSFAAPYLYATYRTDSTFGRKNIVTVLYPHDGAHAKAAMAQISGYGFTGARIAPAGNTSDYALESDGARVITHEDVSWQGLAAFYRMVDGTNKFYFVRQGKSFYGGGSSGLGFSAASEVSLYMRGKEGQIISPGTEVAFIYPGISGVKLDGKTAVLKEKGNGWVMVHVPAGTAGVQLITSAQGAAHHGKTSPAIAFPEKRIELKIGSKVALVDGQKRTIDVPPVIINNRTMVPLRFIGEALGVAFTWDAEDRTVTYRSGGQEIRLVIGQKIPGFDTPPTIIEGRTMVPLRYVAECFGAEVTWDQASRSVLVVK